MTRIICDALLSGYQAFAGIYNVTYPAGAGPGGHTAFSNKAGNLSLYSLNDYWVFCKNLGEPGYLCAQHDNTDGKTVVAKDVGVDDPTFVKDWLSLAPDGKSFAPLLGFGVHTAVGLQETAP